MIRYRSPKQLSLDEFDWPFETALDKNNRLVIGAVIIKHKLCLSDRETVSQIQENPYLQYFVGLPGYQREEPFAPSLFVEIRKRMGQSVFDVFQGAIIDAVEQAKPKQEAKTAIEDTDDEPPAAPGSSSDEDALERQGKLILDATVTSQAIRYPTDLSLLNEVCPIRPALTPLLNDQPP